ncbi:MAG TPA: DinB family protein [Candidatus Deferrimicrobiaceae bacterium]|nr:DinB family protein [Candidatus Deferrimicrobiaceae bacterium]
MDAVDLWLLRYEPVHTFVADDLVADLTDAQVRGRPVPGVNPVAWLIWHAMRVEDVCVNRFVLDRPQVLDAGWPPRLRIARLDVGTGMDDAQVDELCARLDVEQLRGYCRAVTRATLDAVTTLRSLDLEVMVPADRVEHVCTAEGAVAPGASWLTEFWAGGRSRAWILFQTSLLHVYGHYFEGLATKGLWGARSR